MTAQALQMPPISAMESAYSVDQKEDYRLSCRAFAYDRATRARDIITESFRHAHPNATRRVPRDGICHCGDPIAYGDITLTIDEKGREYHNHQRCNSWACPVCAPKRAYSRANEIEQALIAANERGYKCYFITFTVPHRKAHSSKFVIERLNKAYKRFVDCRAIRDLKRDWGYVGAIKCLDYTMTDNGTHAHLHTIWIFDAPGDAWEDAGKPITAIMKRVWDRQVFNECGEHINQAYGYNFEYMKLGDPASPDASSIAKYAAKSISIYCTDHDTSKNGSISPFDLLSAKATDEDKKRYHDFYKGQKGRRHIFFSHGLKKHLQIQDSDPVSDAPTSAIIANISYEHAYFLKDEHQRQEFEKRARGSVALALDWLDQKTKLQQQDMQRRFPDPRRDRYERFQYPLIRYDDAINELDDPLNEVSAVIRKHRQQQDEWIMTAEQINERRMMEDQERAYSRYSLNRERYRRHVENTLKKNLAKSGANRSRHPLRDYENPPAISGVGAAILAADAAMESARVASYDCPLFYGVDESPAPPNVKDEERPAPRCAAPRPFSREVLWDEDFWF